MGSFINFLILLAIGWFIGGANERGHVRRLDAREGQLSHIKVMNTKNLPDGFAPGGVLVTGNVVVAVDYFKVFAARLKTLIGGRLRSYESLLERARREAILRLKAEAAELGADAVYNVRIEFSSVGAQPAAIGGVELLAYGTAVKLGNSVHDRI